MTENPVIEFPLEILNFKCFDETGSGEFSLKPINFIIGRNNAGKSAIVDFFEVGICSHRAFDYQKHPHKGQPLTFRLKRTLTENDIQRVFQRNTSGGEIPGNHYQFGAQFIGKEVTFLADANKNTSLIEIAQSQNIPAQNFNIAKSKLGTAFQWPFNGIGLVRVAAERDVRPEPMGVGQAIQPNGGGLTNAINRQKNDSTLSRELVENIILSDLNEVYQGDAEFTEIITRLDESSNTWEIYISEQDKGDVRLSESGSGLKTILLIIALLRLKPQPQWALQILAIDEPENNLHPALFRRLLEYLAKMRDDYSFVLIVTTHSPIAIDWAARHDDSQVIHVRHDGTRAKLSVASDYVEGRSILDDLDIRASDLLQANGIIWVEGPSDRIYLRRWIDLHSGGTLKEGIHYTIMFYAGKLLSHLSADSPDAASDLIALLSMNRNAAVLIDSDRRLASKTTKGKERKPRMNINGTKKRIKDELERLGGFVWVTYGKEVENYIPIAVFAELVGQTAPYVCEYDDIVRHPLLSSFKEDKIKLAHAASEALAVRHIDEILDLKSQLEQLSQHIKKWNGIAH